MGRLIEGVWDCVFCGTDKIRGSERVCPCCGKTRGQDVKFYMDNPKNYVNEEVAKTINKNPDWLCSYCDSLNRDDLDECHSCGATKDNSAKNYFEHRAEVDKRRAEKQKRLDALMNQEERNDRAGRSVHSQGQLSCEEQYANSPYVPSSAETKSEKYSTRSTNKTTARKVNIHWKKIFTGSAIALAAILMIVLLVNLFTPKVMEVTLSDMTWQRSIGVETLTTCNESDWYLPSGARLKDTRQEIRTYEKVLDHYETKTRTYTERVLDHYEEYVSGHRDLGNGYFEEITSSRPVYRTETRTETYEEPVYRDEPVYATKYYYEIDKWLHSYNSTSQGHKSEEMYWNEPVLKEKQRESGRTTTCYISFFDEKKEKTVTYTMAQSEWETLNPGNTLKIEVVLGHASIYVED